MLMTVPLSHVTIPDITKFNFKYNEAGMADTYRENTNLILRHSVNQKRRNNRTEFIVLDSRMCTACWKCIEVCKKNVFGKINIIIHKHVRIKNWDECSGCGRCVKACPAGAIIHTDKKQETSYEQ